MIEKGISMRPGPYRRSHYEPRRHPRSRLEPKKQAGKKIIDQFLTQLTLAALVISLVMGAQLLGFKNMNNRIAKIKSAITYSPSLSEVASAMIQKTNEKNKTIEGQTIPEIIIEEKK